MPLTLSSLRVISLACLTAFFLPACPAQNVVISEIFYHPPGTNILDEWIEIHNAESVPVDVSAWRLTRGIAFTLPSPLILPPQGFLVLAADPGAFTNRYPSAASVLGPWTGTLSDDGDTLQLEDRGGRIVDSVTYAPGGDWAIRRIGPLDSLGRQGWEWFADHDGVGHSLELIQPRLPNDYGQNWGSSQLPGGTPGAPNSITQSNVPPFIINPTHSPAIPRSTDRVTLAARILDESLQGLDVAVHWRLDGTNAFTQYPLFDDGNHGDGLPQDGLFGAFLPPQPNNSLIEFYLTARDSQGLTRTYPTVDTPTASTRTSHLAYQVDDTPYAGDQPLIRLVIPQAEYDYLANRIWSGAPLSDAMVNGTFIATEDPLNPGASTQIRYLCGFRNRGHGSRYSTPHNVLVAFPPDRPWKERTTLNLNSQYPHSQQIGSTLFRRAGIPIPESRPVQVRINGAQLAKPTVEQFGSYAANDAVNDAFVQRQIPLDREGNLYRGVRNLLPGISSSADLSWKGSDFSAYTNAYTKENHRSRNDGSDFIRLLDVLNNTPDESYAAEVQKVIHVDQWMRYFAVNTLLDNQENSLGIGAPDDFSLYRGTRDTRFLLLPHDMDSILARGTLSVSPRAQLWRMTNVAVIDRFMKHPDFVPRYFHHLNQLATTTFAHQHIAPLFDQLLAGYVDGAALANLKSYQSNHLAQVLALYPHALTVAHDLPVSGEHPRSTTPSIRLRGTGDPATTRSIKVQGQIATWSAWQASWVADSVPLHPGLNNLTIQALGFEGTEIQRIILDVWYDDASVQSVPTSISSPTTWTAANGPYFVPNTLTVQPGATLTLEPGTTVYLGPDVNLIVADGARLIAEGSLTAPIRFATAPDSSIPWGGIVIRGSVGSPESRFVHVQFESYGTTCIESVGGTLFVDHAVFATPSHPYLSLDDSSFIVSHCHFPTTSGSFEPFHGTGGIKPGGRGIVRHCFFGSSHGYNDIIDFTGGNRPSQPILQFYDNVFIGSTDDILDLDGTDAWIEGNIFLHVHRNGSPDSAAAVSGGDSGSNTSEITLIGNLFFDCDNAVTAKQGNFYVLLHNTIVRITREGGQDFDSGVINLRDTTPDITSFGRGAYLEGNIVVDASQLVRNDDVSQSTVTLVDNILPLPWNGAGIGNRLVDPLLEHIPSVDEAVFSTWEAAQVVRHWFRPRPGSPAYRLAAFGRTLGGVDRRGVWISGEPPAQTSATDATLTVGPQRSGFSIPSAPYPEGAGFTHYRWRLDEGPWSDERPIALPIVLSQLPAGPHSVEVSGRNDAGTYQDETELGDTARTSRSRTWTVDPQFNPGEPLPSVRFSEVLARSIELTSEGLPAPDWIEFENPGSTPVDLTGMRLTDDHASAAKFAFPPGTRIEPGGFLRVWASNRTHEAGLSTGFALRREGEQLWLYDSPNRGDRVLDTLTFGPQVPDLSSGRRTDGSWGLCHPTPGAPNIAHPTGSPQSVRLNEWLAHPGFAQTRDFIELFNPSPLPIDLSGCYLSDAAGSPTRHALPPLTFIPGRGHLSLTADGDSRLGFDHLNFRLSSEVGVILFSDPNRIPIDVVHYSSQKSDIPEGRSPDGGFVIRSLPLATPGSPNPGAGVAECTVVSTSQTLLPINATWRFQQTANLDGTQWQFPNFDDTAWPSGPALLAVESSTLPSPGKQTELSLGRSTYYFRTRFLLETNLPTARLQLTMVVDDGALVFLNGQPIWTNGLPNGAPSYSTSASRNVGNADIETVSIPATLLVQGTNVVAAEVHQVNGSSTDVVWGFAIEATLSITNCIPTASPLIAINEVLAASQPANESTPQFTNYVELINLGTETTDLAGLSIAIEPSSSARWFFQAPSPLAAGERLVVTFDPLQPPSPTHANLSLPARGGTILLFDRASSGGALIDAVHYGLQIPRHSIGRFPAGTGSWNLAIPTPGQPNRPAPLGDPSALRLNEWMADPNDGSDWLELHNTSNLPVSLAGLFLTDDLSDRTRSPLPPLSFLGTGPDAFLQLFADGNPAAGTDHLDFSLRRTGEALGIYSSEGTLYDALAFGLQSPGISQGRLPDGDPSLVFLSIPSPGASNRTIDLDSDHDGMIDIWERLHFRTLAQNGTGDFDRDGFPNLAEFLANTDPTDPADGLRFSAIAMGPQVTLEFQAKPGKTYVIESRDAFDSGNPWQKRIEVAPRSRSETISVTDSSVTGTSRFYRLVVP